MVNGRVVYSPANLHGKGPRPQGQYSTGEPLGWQGTPSVASRNLGPSMNRQAEGPDPSFTCLEVRLCTLGNLSYQATPRIED